MVITVQCPECQTSFPVDSAKVPAGGVKVRCSTCAGIFRVEHPEEETPSFESPVFEAPATADQDRSDRYASESDFSVGVESGGAEKASGSGDEWVFETEQDIDPGSLSIDPVGTVEETVEAARDESSFFGSGGAGGAGVAEEAPAEPPPTEPARPVTGFTFGKRDPHEKARRLARVLVSDIVTYNAERHERALAGGTLQQDFEDEIEKSWKEYVEQVGDDIAGSTTYWKEALNEVLAKGQQIF